jgi:hypothetical protein
MSDSIPKNAFCFLIWNKNGGRIDPNYRPVFGPEEGSDDPGVGQRVGGYCEHAIDCATCLWMQEELSKHPPNQVAWLCPECAGEVGAWAKYQQIGRLLWGHYSEGYCQNPSCWMIERTGSPKWSIMLQLVLGDWQRR